MDCEAPIPAPAPGVLADMCARRAWDDDTDDTSRQLLEWAAEVIRSLVVDRCKAINRAEHLEAEAGTYAEILYGRNQKGGSA